MAIKDHEWSEWEVQSYFAPRAKYICGSKFSNLVWRSRSQIFREINTCNLTFLKSRKTGTKYNIAFCSSMDQIFNASGSTGAGTGEVLCVHIESKVLSELASLLIQVAPFPACVHIWYKLGTWEFQKGQRTYFLVEFYPNMSVSPKT